MRVTGTVLRVEDRSGVSNENTPEARSWKFTTARILEGQADFVDVTLGDRLPRPTEGEVVDWIVEVYPRRLRSGALTLNVTATSPFAN